MLQVIINRTLVDDTLTQIYICRFWFMYILVTDVLHDDVQISVRTDLEVVLLRCLALVQGPQAARVVQKENKINSQPSFSAFFFFWKSLVAVLQR